MALEAAEKSKDVKTEEPKTAGSRAFVVMDRIKSCEKEADEIKKSAENQAKALIADAEKEALAIISSAREEAVACAKRTSVKTAEKIEAEKAKAEKERALAAEKLRKSAESKADAAVAVITEYIRR